MHATAPYVSFTEDGEKFKLQCSPMLREKVKMIPGATYKHKEEAWHLTKSWTSALALRAEFPDMTLAPDVHEWGAGESLVVLERLGIKAGDCFEYPGLYPFQNTGASFLANGERCILADDMGVGKTVQAIAALASVPQGVPALIVSTNSMMHGWERELHKWAPDLTVSVVTGSAGQRAKALVPGFDVYIIGWANVMRHSRLAPYGSIALTLAERAPKELNNLGINCVIVDEAHRMVDPKAKQTRAVWAVQHKARYRWSLTGTPITNSPEDLWAILHGIAPEEYPSRSVYISRFLLSGHGFFGGLEIYGLRPERQAELFQVLDSRLLRRLKAEVLPDLPAKVYSVREATLGTAQRKMYKQMQDHMLAAVEDGSLLFADNPLTQLTRLLQMAAATPITEEDAEGRTQVTALAMPSSKVTALFELIEEAPDEPLVIFMASLKLARLIIEQLEKHGKTVTSVTGDVTGQQRDDNILAFQEGSAQYMVCTIQAGGEGITLTRASTLVMLQRSYSLVQNKQAEDRIHRIGQAAASCQIIDIQTSDTVEAGVLDILLNKDGHFESVVRDKAKLRKLIKAG